MRTLIGASFIVALGCGSGSTTTTDAGMEAAPADTGAGFAFQPSNVNMMGIDTAKVEDADITASCTIQSTMGGDQDCFTTKATMTTFVQSDSSKIFVMVVKSLRIESAAHLTISGDLPCVIIALGDMTILGTIDAHASADTATVGGYSQEMNAMKGGGPGGGAAGTGMANVAGFAAGGGSYCGTGGVGSSEKNGGAAGAATPAYGATDIRPLVGGSSGGSAAESGGGGGGAVQLVAFGNFSMNAGSYVNVGGGGGTFGGTTGQNAAGGGSGGSILIEATNVAVGGILAANGGGGGGCGTASGAGGDATADGTAALGGAGTSKGGTGAAAATITGAAGMDQSGDCAGAGGGGAGRIRLNTMSGTATTTSGTFSPASSTSCLAQGMVRAAGSGP